VVKLNSLPISYPRNYFAIDNQLSFVSSDKNFRVSGFDSDQVVVYTQTCQAVTKLERTKIKLDADGYSVAFNGAGAETQYFVATTNSVVTPDLESVMLVGGDVYDYKDSLGLGAISFVSTLYNSTGPIVAFSPMDRLYGNIDVDGVPEIAIGRLPVRSVNELQVLLDKMEVYVGIQNPKTNVLVADAVDASLVYDFTQSSNAVASILPAGLWSVDKVYVDGLDYTAARQSLIKYYTLLGCTISLEV
jgi:hypothetical protein